MLPAQEGRFIIRCHVTLKQPMSVPCWGEISSNIIKHCICLVQFSIIFQQFICSKIFVICSAIPFRMAWLSVSHLFTCPVFVSVFILKEHFCVRGHIFPLDNKTRFYRINLFDYKLSDFYPN